MSAATATLWVGLLQPDVVATVGITRPSLVRHTSGASMDDRFVIDEDEIEAGSLPILPAGIGATLQNLEEFAECLEEDTDELDQPKPYAFRFARNMIESAGSLLDWESNVPPANACPDIGGGLRMTWRGRMAELRLIIPGGPTGRGYIYYHDGQSSKVYEDFQSLGRLLKALSED